MGDVKGSHLAEKIAKLFFGPVGIQGGFAINFSWASMPF